MKAVITSCQVIRRMLIKHSTLNIATGETSSMAREEWVTRPCGTPLFGDEERAVGKCRSCAKGWTHPNNYPVEAAR